MPDPDFAVSFLKKIRARVHGCHAAALVKVSAGLDRFHLRAGHQKDCRDLYFDDNLLAFGNVDGCSTCETFLYRGYGEGVMNAEERRRVRDALNAPYDGLEDATRRLAPILGLFAPGYYVVADFDQYPTVWSGDGFSDFILRDGESPFATGIRFRGGYQACDLHTAPLFLWASQSPRRMDWDRVRHYMEVFEGGREDLPRPVAVFMNGGMSLVIDGHHKVAAAAMLGRTVRTNIIFRIKTPEPVVQTLRQGGKMFFCAPGTKAVFRRDGTTGDERLEYDVSYGPAFICNSREEVLSRVDCWENADPLPKVEPTALRMGEWDKLSDSDCAFVKKYRPAKVAFPELSDIVMGTHVDLNHARRSLANLRSAYERFHRLGQDGLLMAEDLIAYRELFPKGKWISDDELAWLRRMAEAQRLAPDEAGGEKRR